VSIKGFSKERPGPPRQNETKKETTGILYNELKIKKRTIKAHTIKEKP